MFYRLTDSIKRARFDYAVRDVLRSPSLPACSSPVKVVSMVRNADLSMYMLAIKSFRKQMPQTAISILDDGTLTPSDHETLQRHLNPAEIIAAKDIVYGRGVKGIRWEILLYIAECIQKQYVIHIDSDTLTLGDIGEVHAAVRENASFTLGTRIGTELSRATEVCERMQEYEPRHVQIVAEQNLDKLPRYGELLYVRGNSGLAGFARGSFTRTAAEDFYEVMAQTIGPIWLRHGAFQVSSNFFVANSPNGRVLPWPKYMCYHPNIPYEDSTFLHFVGTYRFDRGVYIREARRVLELLMDGAS